MSYHHNGYYRKDDVAFTDRPRAAITWEDQEITRRWSVVAAAVRRLADHPDLPQEAKPMLDELVAQIDSFEDGLTTSLITQLAERLQSVLEASPALKAHATGLRQARNRRW